MKTLAIILAIVGVSSAATFIAMDEKDLEKVMMEQMYARDPSHPFMGLGAVMATQRQQKEHDAETPFVGEGEAAGEREARDAEAYGEPEQDAPAKSPRQPFSMFGNGMMGMMFPDMMFNPSQNGAPYRNGNGHAASNGNGNGANGNGYSANGNGNGYSAATPYSAAGQPSGNGHAVSNGNGNGYKRPNGNGNSRPGNGHSRPNGNGNGKRGGGSAAAASAASFSKGSNSYSSSQAQAFGGSF